MSIGPNRRAFIGGLGAAVTWPLAAHGQQRVKVARLGVLLFSTPSTDPTLKIVQSSLNALGYVEGRDFIFAYRYAEGHPERLAELAAALVQEKPDLLIALGGDVAPSAVKATSTIPIVFLSSADPVELGLRGEPFSARHECDRRHVITGRHCLKAFGASQGNGSARAARRFFVEPGTSR